MIVQHVKSSITLKKRRFWCTSLNLFGICLNSQRSASLKELKQLVSYRAWTEGVFEKISTIHCWLLHKCIFDKSQMLLNSVVQLCGEGKQVCLLVYWAILGFFSLAHVVPKELMDINKNIQRSYDYVIHFFFPLWWFVLSSMVQLLLSPLYSPKILSWLPQCFDCTLDLM